MTAARDKFIKHVEDCNNAIYSYDFLVEYNRSADFGLRFVWVASVSALDYYITELIVEKGTEKFASNDTLTSKMNSHLIPLSIINEFSGLSKIDAITQFNSLLTRTLRYRTFQKADDISDGLSYIWNEKHKWQVISDALEMDKRDAMRKLNSISARRDIIVHSADYNDALSEYNKCERDDAVEVISYISKIVDVIDDLVV